MQEICITLGLKLWGGDSKAFSTTSRRRFIAFWIAPTGCRWCRAKHFAEIVPCLPIRSIAVAISIIRQSMANNLRWVANHTQTRGNKNRRYETVSFVYWCLPLPGDHLWDLRQLFYVIGSQPSAIKLLPQRWTFGIIKIFTVYPVVSTWSTSCNKAWQLL